jgi:hypothetical protein
VTTFVLRAEGALADPRRHRRLNRVRTRTRRGGAMPEVWNAIRKDRAVLHRERPKIIGRGIVQLPPLGCEAECPVHLQIFSNKQMERRHSSMTERAPRKVETEV